MIRIEETSKAEEKPTLNVVDRLDAAARWAAMTPEQQMALGVAAIDLATSWACVEEGCGDAGETLPLGRAGNQAEHQAIAAVLEAFDAAVPASEAFTADGQPKLPASLGMVCAHCGCSEDDACPGRCGWAEPNLCTVCAKLDSADDAFRNGGRH